MAIVFPDRLTLQSPHALTPHQTVAGGVLPEVLPLTKIELTPPESSSADRFTARGVECLETALIVTDLLTAGTTRVAAG